MIPKVELRTIGLPTVMLGGVVWNASVGANSGHEHDYVGNWLWDDGGCILWDDGSVMAL